MQVSLSTPPSKKSFSLDTAGFCNYGKKLIATWHKLTHWEKRLDILRLCRLSPSIDRQPAMRSRRSCCFQFFLLFFNEISFFFCILQPTINFMVVSFMKIAPTFATVLCVRSYIDILSGWAEHCEKHTTSAALCVRTWCASKGERKAQERFPPTLQATTSEGKASVAESSTPQYHKLRIEVRRRSYLRSPRGVRQIQSSLPFPTHSKAMKKKILNGCLDVGTAHTFLNTRRYYYNLNVNSRPLPTAVNPHAWLKPFTTSPEIVYFVTV